jgi:hypothetical protein
MQEVEVEMETEGEPLIYPMGLMGDWEEAEARLESESMTLGRTTEGGEAEQEPGRRAEGGVTRHTKFKVEMCPGQEVVLGLGAQGRVEQRLEMKLDAERGLEVNLEPVPEGVGPAPAAGRRVALVQCRDILAWQSAVAAVAAEEEAELDGE